MASTLNGTGVTFSDASTQSVGTSGNFKFNSGYGSEAVAYGCRAWVNFNGTGTVAIRASGNVSSITDNGTGNYTVNFSTAMPDTNYSAFTEMAWTTSGTSSSIVSKLYGADGYLTGSVRIQCQTSDNQTPYDTYITNVSVFR